MTAIVKARQAKVKHPASESSNDRGAAGERRPAPYLCRGCGEFFDRCKCDDLDWFTPETRAMGYFPLTKAQRRGRK